MIGLDAIAFPWLLFSDDGTLLNSGPGSLFGMPPQCSSEENERYYASISTDGWHTCPKGFAAYRQSLEKPSSSYLVLPGLRVRPHCRFQGKADWLSITTNTIAIERHVLSVLFAIGAVHEEFDKITRQNIHEVRGLNGGIYHDCQELSDLIENNLGNAKHAHELSINIIALSQILSARLDYINYIANQSLTYSDIEQIPVYNRFDKMVRCFMAKAAKIGVTFSLTWQSFSSVSGPKNLFELVPYLLIDNALKYSPPSQKIVVSFLEKDNTLRVSVSSVGPRIADGEDADIFNQSFRGQYAKKSGKEGTGIGLSVLKSLVENMYFGSIGLKRGPNRINLSGIPYDDITFFIDLPTEANYGSNIKNGILSYI